MGSDGGGVTGGSSGGGGALGESAGGGRKGGSGTDGAGATGGIPHGSRGGCGGGDAGGEKRAAVHTPPATHTLAASLSPAPRLIGSDAHPSSLHAALARTEVTCRA